MEGFVVIEVRKAVKIPARSHDNVPGKVHIGLANEGDRLDLAGRSHSKDHILPKAVKRVRNSVEVPVIGLHEGTSGEEAGAKDSESLKATAFGDPKSGSPSDRYRCHVASVQYVPEVHAVECAIGPFDEAAGRLIAR